MRVLARTVTALLAAAVPVAALLSAPAAAGAEVPATPAASPVSLTFGYTGSIGTFTVPVGVYSVNVAIVGAAGGDGAANVPCPHGYGGPGSRITASLAVTPGATLSFFVGEGGHLSGAGGISGPTGLTTGGHGGGDGDVGSGNGGGGGGATTLSYLGRLVATAGGGGGGGGRGISAVVCGGDGGAAGSPAQDGYNGTQSTPGSYGIGGWAWRPGPYGPPDPYGTTGPGASGAGGGGGGGAGVPNGGGGQADQHTVAAGGGGGGAGGTSAAGAPLTDIAYSTQGQSGSAGSVTISYGHPVDVNVPTATAQGDQLVLHAIVDGTDGGGTVDFVSDANGVIGPGGTPIPGCSGLPLAQVDTALFEATCQTGINGVGTKVTAVYSGDYAYGWNYGSGLYTINRLGTGTTTTTGSATVAPGDTITVDAQVLASDGGGSVSLLDDGAAIGSCTPLTGAPLGLPIAAASCTATLPAGVHHLVVAYSGDRGYLPSTSTPLTVIAASAPTIAGIPARAVVGTPYSFAYTLGGEPAPTVSVTAGSLPPGLALSADGVLSGTPTAPGSYPVTLTAGNPASGTSAELDSTITVVQQSVSVSPARLDFGSAVVGTMVHRTVTVTNTGTVPWTYTGATVSTPQLAVTGGTCVTGHGAAAGSTCTATIAFTPSAAGSRPGTVTLKGNPSATIATTATGLAVRRTASVTPASISLHVIAGRTAGATATLHNTGNVPVTVSSRTVTGDPRLTVSGGTCRAGHTLEPGAACTVTLVYRPTAAESRTANLTIVDSAGTQHVVLHLSAAAQVRKLAVSTTAVHFGAHRKGTTSRATVTVTNAGNITWTPKAPTTTKPFAVTSTTCHAALAPGRRCTVTVAFHPTAAGNRTGYLTLPGSFPAVRVTLTGRGI